MRLIKIATDFSDVPIGRYISDSDVSGERFRDELLCPALESGDQVCVDIDGVEGYGSSFLDEAFGGLVRKAKFTSDGLRTQLKIQNNDRTFAIYRDLIWKYITEAVPDSTKD